MNQGTAIATCPRRAPTNDARRNRRDRRGAEVARQRKIRDAADGGHARLWPSGTPLA